MPPPTRNLLRRSATLAFIGSSAAASLHRAPLRRDELPATSSTSIRFINAADPFNFENINLKGEANVLYTANITVDGQSFAVMLDTGSSDLWLNTQNVTFSSQAKNTHVSDGIAYVDTTNAEGDIYVAPAQFGNFSIPSQAFINAPGSNATAVGELGILGISAPSLSGVQYRLENTSYNGVPVLQNIFSSYPNVSQYMTFLLSRSDLGITDGGIFTIGEVDPSWSAVQYQPKIPVPNGMNEWVGLMDGIVVDGKSFSGHGILSKDKGIPEKEKNQTLAVLDTGTSIALLPQYYWDAMYKDIPGLEQIKTTQWTWSLPCDTRRNVSFVFNGVEYPVNPLDLTRVTTTNDTHETICVNAFIPLDVTDQGIDMVIGDSFLRNVYALFNFGNWSTPGAEAPYMQILSTTNQAVAWEQFGDLNNARIQQWNELGGQYNASNPSDSSSTTSA